MPVRQRLTLVATILKMTVVFLDATRTMSPLPRSATTSTPGLPGGGYRSSRPICSRSVSLLLVGGSIGDQFGRRRMFMIGSPGSA